MVFPVRRLLTGPRLPAQTCAAGSFLVLAACGLAPLRGGGNAVHEADLGVATVLDVRERIPEFLLTHDFEVLRLEETGSGLRVETRWRERRLFPGEEARGFRAARVRIVIHARARTRRPLVRSGTLNRVHFRAETELARDPGRWEVVPVGEPARALMESLAAELRVKLHTGPRQF